MLLSGLGPGSVRALNSDVAEDRLDGRLDVSCFASILQSLDVRKLSRVLPTKFLTSHGVSAMVSEYSNFAGAGDDALL